MFTSISVQSKPCLLSKVCEHKPTFCAILKSSLLPFLFHIWPFRSPAAEVFHAPAPTSFEFNVPVSHYSSTRVGDGFLCCHSLSFDVHAVLFEECKWYNTEKFVSCREVFCTLIQTILYILIKMYPTNCLWCSRVSTYFCSSAWSMVKKKACCYRQAVTATVCFQ